MLQIPNLCLQLPQFSVPHMAGESRMRKRKPFWHPILGKLRKIHTKRAPAHSVGNKSSTWPKAECLCCRGGSDCMSAAKLALKHLSQAGLALAPTQPTEMLLVVFKNTPGLWISCCQLSWNNPQPSRGGQTQLSMVEWDCVSSYQTILVLPNFHNISD